MNVYYALSIAFLAALLVFKDNKLVKSFISSMLNNDKRGFAIRTGIWLLLSLLFFLTNRIEWPSIVMIFLVVSGIVLIDWHKTLYKN
ncbi:hypothetical protein BVJ53_09680 [Lacticaseibacillus chiayiensis]|uniref:DUF3784 domain-containing protein n=1 Tax=Lacticaseibacillus chiayiensis TaxID=2100821 RepID=A0A4V1P0K6_9LACO|nr:hypothetical protein BVJ53_09680 [Lacticaseibacillus chiayiensis]RXT55327.1 hypothetical protein CHT97_12570 [Lacticaseibacillus chiayiensis]